jgi:beta-aspartyl-peptidase (threonine type)
MTAPRPWSLALHGGAGLIARNSLSDTEIARARAGMQKALDAGAAVLSSGGTALDAVTETIVILEEWPHFNAGRGSVLAEHGEAELDAALMAGDRRAGAIAATRRTRNPIRLARAVLDDGLHVFLAGPGADAWAAQRGLEQVEPAFFVTEHRRAQLRRVQATGAVVLDHDTPEDGATGTVGAVARDTHGHLAAGNSTGGMANKRSGRVGDTPVIGAGTWACDQTCAVAATGHGEPFIRVAAAHRISDLVELAGLSLDDAAARVLEEVRQLGGTGGFVAIDARGTVSMPFNSGGMYRATANGTGATELGRSVAIW